MNYWRKKKVFDSFWLKILRSSSLVHWAQRGHRVLHFKLIKPIFFLSKTILLSFMNKPTKKKPTAEEIKQAKTWSVWEKEPSDFDYYYDSEETFYVLEGNVTVTWEGGEISFGKGDLVTFPKGLSCRWHVKEKIRKNYNFK
jgi:uncharacterized cupin superfamily protein